MSTTTSTDWTTRYFVPWSQVHPGSRGGQSGNVHLVRATDPGHHSVLPGLRKPRVKGDALCDPSRRAWFVREPKLNENTDGRCPRCVKHAERLGIAWPDEEDQ